MQSTQRSDNRLEYLLQRHINSTATEEERLELNGLLRTHWDRSEGNGATSHINWEKMLTAITEPAPTGIRGRLRRLQRHSLRYAVAVVLCIIAGVYFYFADYRNSATEQIGVPHKSAASTEITPGGERAVLVLANGSTILLDSASDGVLSNGGNGKVIKLGDGSIVYEAGGDMVNATAYNTMRTPRGGQYRLTLPDGSKAWLNASSSIRFPSAFSGDQRKVSITGEVYFEVEHDKMRPFIVEINAGTAVQVLGTSFNINAYSDEPTMGTTLLEGSVRMISGGKEAVLVPGQQARIAGQSPEGGIDVVLVDTEAVMSWKNGLFNFDNKNLEEVMRQLSRWYDIDVVYEKGVPDITLGGKLGKDLNLSEIMEVLKQYEIHFKMEGRRMIVLP